MIGTYLMFVFQIDLQCAWSSCQGGAGHKNVKSRFEFFYGQLVVDAEQSHVFMSCQV